MLDLFQEYEEAPKDATKTEQSSVKLTSPDIVEKIYKLAETIDWVFEENQLHYWATGGTILGVMRHQGLIPWDDDIDICVFQKDEHKLNSIDYKSHGLQII